mmetsp:Transcript_69427/g.215547  ORF Transcript_69427/g.215547 Transcript_69427/m.215547 type:complete len:230 (+) Transcript_69427:1100-1789(+)
MPRANTVRISPACQRCSRPPANKAQGLSTLLPDHRGCTKSSRAMQPLARRRCSSTGLFSSFHSVAGFTASSAEARPRPPWGRRCARRAAMVPLALASKADMTLTCAPKRPRSGPKMAMHGAGRTCMRSNGSVEPSALHCTFNCLGPAWPITVAMRQWPLVPCIASTACPSSKCPDFFCCAASKVMMTSMSTSIWTSWPRQFSAHSVDTGTLARSGCSSVSVLMSTTARA